jgi:hypothetical protein
LAVAPWTPTDEGYLRAYEWASALAGGASLPTEALPIALGPGEVAHGHFAPVGMSGYFGEQREHRRSFFLVGGPVGLALTGAASMAYNASKRADAQRAAQPRWHRLGSTEVVVTSQRLIVTSGAENGSLWYAETGPLQLAPGPGGQPVVRLQPAGHPLLQLESPFTPLLYVFVHYLVSRQAPGLPLPPGLLERARAQGRTRS